MNINITIYKKNGEVRRYRKVIKRRFFQSIEAKNFKKAYVYVDYGLGKNAFGKKVKFYNSGTYYKPEDVKWAIRTFINEYK